MATVLLSNPVLDHLYTIRRIFVGQFNMHQKAGDKWGMDYHEEKVKAMDEAIAAYATTHKIPAEHLEQTMLERARVGLGLSNDRRIIVPPANPE